MGREVCGRTPAQRIFGLPRGPVPDGPPALAHRRPASSRIGRTVALELASRPYPLTADGRRLQLRVWRGSRAFLGARGRDAPPRGRSALLSWHSGPRQDERSLPCVISSRLAECCRGDVIPSEPLPWTALGREATRATHLSDEGLGEGHDAASAVLAPVGLMVVPSPHKTGRPMSRRLQDPRHRRAPVSLEALPGVSSRQH